MTDVPEIEEILEEIADLEGVSEAFLVSRAGTYVAGPLPEGVDRETYASMFAVLLGSADTATSQIREEMEAVTVYLRDSKLAVFPNGAKALFVLRVGDRVRIRRLRSALAPFSKRLDEYL